MKSRDAQNERIRRHIELAGQFVDLPFLPPPDTVIDIPVPPSVNRSRKVNWAARPAVEAWVRHADALLKQAWAGGRKPEIIPGGFEVTIIVDPSSKIDLDNGIKSLIDYARRVELVVDDSQKYLRALHVVWGEAPQGCRLILRGAA